MLRSLFGRVGMLSRGRVGGGVVCGAFGLALVGCGPQGGTDVGNGFTTVELELAAVTKPKTTAQAITLEDGVVIQHIYFVIAEISLERREGGECEDSGEVDLHGPFVADLTGAGIIGGAPSFPKVGDAFCELKVGYHRLEADDAPAGAPVEALDRSVFVTGQRADGTPFTIASRRDDEMELTAGPKGSFSLAKGLNRLFLAFELQSWISAVDLNSLGDKPIVIDNSNNADRLLLFEKAVEQSARLFRDDDGDGVLDLNEQETALAE